MKGITKILLISSLMILFSSAYSQTAFVCEGQGYITFKKTSTSTILAEILVDYSNYTVNINELGEVNGSINSIGYRTQDNLIYGVHAIDFDLYVIGAEPKSTVLKKLPLNNSLQYPAGDITPDGKYLILIGNTPPSASTVDKEMVFVNLEDPSYPIERIIDISNHNTRIVDIAFHPITGEIYAFDLNGSRLVVLDSSNGSIIKAYNSTSVSYQIGAIYFDQYGNLRGYGKETSESLQKDLFDIDLESGELTLVASSSPTQNSDACSCPYTIDLLKSVNINPAESCSEVIYYFEILNLTSQTQNNIRLTDQFPVGFRIVSVENPFGGNIVSGTGSTNLDISEMSIPIGRDTIVVTVYLDKVQGNFLNQAKLSNLPASYGNLKLSDDPKTKIIRDSTSLMVLKNGNGQVFNFDTTICYGDSIVLILPNDSGWWSTGHQEQSITIYEEQIIVGSYIDECGDTNEIYYNIRISLVDVDLDNPNYEYKLGIPLNLEAIIVENTGEESTFKWIGSTTQFSCDSCQFTEVVSTSGGQVQVVLTNEFGCTDTAFTGILLFEYNPFYIPNAFSPNGDNLNDVFYVYGEGYEIVYLEIYDQWGGLQYRFSPGSLTGDPGNSWDGREFHSGELFSNVFIYVGTLRDARGQSYTISGTITLVR